jgi:formate C-acetyltransferase
MTAADNIVNISDYAPKTEDLYLSDTVKYLKDVKDSFHDRKEIPVRDRVYERVLAENPDDLQAVRFAKAFAEFLKVKKIHIDPHDLLAGFTYRYTYNTTMPIDCPDDFDPLYRPPISLDSEREYKTILEYHGLSEDSTEAKELRIFLEGVDAWLYKHWFSGHILPGYDRLVEIGFSGLVELGRKSVAEHEGVNKEFARSMLITNEAAVMYIGRYAELAEKMAAETDDPLQKKNLSRIAESSRWLMHGAPRNFFDAVQCLWYGQEIMMAENVPASESLGRMDKYMYPFYEKDVKEGKLTYNEASELIDALWIKFSGNLHSYQAVTVSGTNEDGSCFENDLTYMLMQSSRKMMFDQPLMDLRYNDHMSKRLWNETVALIKTGTGFPGIFYDPICIRAKESTGQSPEDARNYAIIGCVETGLPGHEYTPTELVHLNWPKLFELMFNHGHATMQDFYAPLFDDKDLDSIKTFDEFYAWYKSEMEQYTALAMRSIELVETMIPWRFPTPYLSSLMVGCYEKGMDVTGGPCRYNNTGISTCGLATAVDSLAAIKKVVFEDKLVKLSEFTNILNNNFAGYEDIHNIVLHHCPKFGNDNDEVDFYMSDLIAAFAGVVNSRKNPRGGHYMMGLYSVEDHAKAGMKTGATPDGRLAGSFESNSMASVQGMDVNGPTALVNSVVKTDLNACTNGMVLDLKFNPGFMENPRHVEALHQLIDTYFHTGGMEIQISVVDRQTLLNAQKEPEKYYNLVVRVSGFSAYFRSLNKTTQDEIIARTEYHGI